MAHFIAALLLLLVSLSAWGQSTIDPNVPAMDQPLTSAPIRNNFAHATQDVNALYAKIAQQLNLMTVANNTAMAAVATINQTNQIVSRLGYAAPDDGPALSFQSEPGTCAANGRVNDGGSCVDANDGGSWFALFDAGGADIRQLGASIAATDNSTAIQAWAKLACSVKLTAPPGIFNLQTAPIVFPLCNNGLIDVGGIYGTALTYTGTATTPDICLFGDPTYATQVTGWSVKGLMCTSTTQMTAGSAIHIANMVASVFDQSNAGGQYAPGGDPAVGTTKPWNGIWCDYCFDVWWNNSEASAKSDVARASGRVSHPMAGFYLTNCKISGGIIGLHLGGATGAVNPVNCDIIANGTNVVVDQGIVAAGNVASIFDSATAIDTSTTGPGILINDPGFVTKQVMVFNGTWNCSNATDGLYVQNINHQKVIANFGALCNNARDGLRVDDTLATISDNNGPGIYINGGFGVNATAPTSHLYLDGVPLNNISGPYNANAELGSNTTPGQATCALGVPCYTKDFSGNIHQFFGASFQGSANSILTSTVSFPLQFPNLALINTLSCALQSFVNGAAQMSVALTGATNAGVTVQLVSSNTVTSAQPVLCQVWGY
jgi:hypothetical protein